MPTTDNPRRTDLRLTTGSKICVLAAVPFLVAAAYFFWMPIGVSGSAGRFGCQSAFNPPSNPFSSNVCGSINEVYQFRAAAMLVTGLLIAGLGVLFFGLDRRVGRQDITGEVEHEGDPDEGLDD